MENAYDRLEALLRRLGDKHGVVLDETAEGLLRAFTKAVVNDAARVCFLRSTVQHKAASCRKEAESCGRSIKHAMLARLGEKVCIWCQGEGCEPCAMTGVELPRRKA